MGNNVSRTQAPRPVEPKNKKFSLGPKKREPPLQPPPPSRTPRFALPSQKRAIAEAEAAEQRARKSKNRLSLRSFKNKSVRRATSDPTNVRSARGKKTKKSKKKNLPPSPPLNKSLIDKLNPATSQQEAPPVRKPSLLDKITNNRAPPPPPPSNKKKFKFMGNNKRNNDPVPRKKPSGFGFGRKKKVNPPPPSPNSNKFMQKLKKQL